MSTNEGRIMYSNNYITVFCQNVKKIRQRNRLTKKEMARRLRISQYTLNEIENGRLTNRVGIDILKRIEEVFSVTVNDQFKA